LLTKHFLAMYNRELGKKISGYSSDALSIIRTYRWPGNIRELQSVVRKAMLMAPGPVILPEFLPAEIVKKTVGSNATDTNGMTQWPDSADGSFDLGQFIDNSIRDGRGGLYAETLGQMEFILISRILQHHTGNQSRAAEQLGITRGSLRNKIRLLGIRIEQVVSTND
jgi:two-component system nitrogen regulation response regulator GlnG